MRRQPARAWKLDGFKPSGFRGGYFGRSGAILQKIIFAPSAFSSSSGEADPPRQAERLPYN
jgi:hypothetical protein